MDNKRIKAIYENFHSTTSSQKRIIKSNNFTYKIILNILDYYLSDNNKNILDIGCGAGTLAIYLANRGNKTLGIDISEKAISSAQRSAKNLNLTNLSFQKMNFPNEVPNEKYHLIICSEVLEHLENDHLALKKIYKLLRPKGILIISTPSINAPMYRLGLANNFDKKVGHLRRYSLDKLVTMCKITGFLILDTKKTEGVVRNFLFINPIAGKFIRFIKFFLVDFVTLIDNISLHLFGESQIFVILTK